MFETLLNCFVLPNNFIDFINPFLTAFSCEPPSGVSIVLQNDLSEDFSLYIHRPTATDKSFAPKYCDSFYVLCPVANLQGKIKLKKKT